MKTWMKQIAACALLMAAPNLIAGPTSNLEAKSFAKEGLVELIQQSQIDMCWSFGEYSHFRFASSYENLCLTMRLDNLSEDFSHVIEKMGDKLRSPEPNVWTFSYQMNREGTRLNKRRVPRRYRPESKRYILTERRVFDGAMPRSMTDEQLASICSGEHKVLFYTGAGLSVAAGVPSMEQLDDLVAFHSEEQCVATVEKILSNPKAMAQKARAFHHACLFKKPTQGHKAIKALSFAQNTRVITENLDSLHEQSGMDPYRLNNVEEAKALLTPEVMQSIDYIVCVGLSFDDRGFLGWYKEHHPQGTIIAVNLAQPSYLGDEDYLVTGDLQEVLPYVSQAVLGDLQLAIPLHQSALPLP